MSVALMLQFIVSGAAWTEEHLRIYPRRWIAIGLLLAWPRAVVPWHSATLLTTHTAHLTLPALGELHVPSALFFDTGVFALVLGATMLILTALAHQSIRSHRWADEQAEEGGGAPCRRRGRRGANAWMEIVLAIAIGVLTGWACTCCCARAPSRSSWA